MQGIFIQKNNMFKGTLSQDYRPFLFYKKTTAGQATIIWRNFLTS